MAQSNHHLKRHTLHTRIPKDRRLHGTGFFAPADPRKARGRTHGGDNWDPQPSNPGADHRNAHLFKYPGRRAGDPGSVWHASKIDALAAKIRSAIASQAERA